ncbi:MAG TPA: hypothetical protein VL984_11765 [Acidimicrobiales bacterium]|nr:hypothetical protein [Acidimicrobiales bacterium]
MTAALSIALIAVVPNPAWAAGQSGDRHGQPFPGPTTTSPATSTTTTVPGMPLPEAPPPLAEDTCVKGNWEQQVEGRPTGFSPSSDGAYLWHDPDGGWALRVTDVGAKARLVFSGFLYSASGQFTDVTALGSGNGDIVYETGNKHTVLFRFVDFGVVDGLNFGTSCSKAFTVNIHSGGRLLPAGEVFLGTGGANPLANPFKVERVRLEDALP